MQGILDGGVVADSFIDGKLFERLLKYKGATYEWYLGQSEAENSFIHSYSGSVVIGTSIGGLALVLDRWSGLLFDGRRWGVPKLHATGVHQESLAEAEAHHWSSREHCGETIRDIKVLINTITWTKNGVEIGRALNVGGVIFRLETADLIFLQYTDDWYPRASFENLGSLVAEDSGTTHFGADWGEKQYIETENLEQFDLFDEEFPDRVNQLLTQFVNPELTSQELREDGVKFSFPRYRASDAVEITGLELLDKSALRALVGAHYECIVSLGSKTFDFSYSTAVKTSLGAVKVWVDYELEEFLDYPGELHETCILMASHLAEQELDLALAKDAVSRTYEGQRIQDVLVIAETMSIEWRERFVPMQSTHSAVVFQLDNGYVAIAKGYYDICDLEVVTGDKFNLEEFPFSVCSWNFGKSVKRVYRRTVESLAHGVYTPN